MDELNKNQKAFCREYVKNGNNGTSAYLKVYKCKEDAARINASKLLTKTNVKKYIDELQEKIEDSDIMTIKERMKFLTQILNDDVKEKAYSMFGDEFEKNANFKTKLNAIDILNKMDGVYTNNINLNGDVDFNITIDYGDSDEHNNSE